MTRKLSEPEMNVRGHPFFLAFTVGCCTGCGRQTALVAIGLPAGHERFDDGQWQRIDAPALLFELEALMPDIAVLLRECCPQFHAGIDVAGERYGWRNHCQSCGQLQSDYWLHCEPGGAFLPLDAEAASRIDLIVVDAAFAAAACGLSDGVPFLDAMRRSG